MALVNQGYTGYLEIGGTKVRFTDGSIAARQEINAPDMVMGSWDRMAYVYGPVTIDGSVSGYVTESFAAGNGIWEWGVKRAACGALTEEDLSIVYFCDTPDEGFSSRTFPSVLANSINISATAGDIVNFSIDVIGATAPTDGPGWSEFDTAEKLVTWDKLGVTVAGGTGNDFGTPALSAFDITISNNVEVVYKLGQDSLFPFALVPGMRSISGSVTAYNAPNANGADAWDDYGADDTGTVGFSLPGGGSKTVNVQFHRIEPTATSGLVTSTLAFTGVTKQDALDA